MRIAAPAMPPSLQVGMDGMYPGGSYKAYKDGWKQTLAANARRRRARLLQEYASMAAADAEGGPLAGEVDLASNGGLLAAPSLLAQRRSAAEAGARPAYGPTINSTVTVRRSTTHTAHLPHCDQCISQGGWVGGHWVGGPRHLTITAVASGRLHNSMPSMALISVRHDQ